MRKWELDQIIMVSEILSYMAGCEKEKGKALTLEEAYEQKGVSKEMRLRKEEVEEIISQYLSR